LASNNWQEKKRNNLKDFVNVAGPLGVTHFLILSNPKSLPHLRFSKSPQGPTFTFQIEEYALAADIANSQKRPRCPPGIFQNPPLVCDTNVENCIRTVLMKILFADTLFFLC